MIESKALTGDDLALADVWAVAVLGEPVALADSARERMAAARDIVEQAIHGAQEHTYGVNTGFGRFVSRAIPEELTEELQLRLLRSHACGVGEPYPDEIVRAAMLLRANALAKGYSGARVATVELLVECLNRGVLPYVPSRGSVGASGDLAPLAHLALPLIGEGEAWLDGGRRYTSLTRGTTVSSSAVTTYTYDPNGNRLTLTDPNGNASPASGDGRTTYGYDRANRQTSIDHTDTTPDVSFTYDAVGNRLTMVDGSGTETRTYDNLDRLKTVTRGSAPSERPWNISRYIFATRSGVSERFGSRRSSPRASRTRRMASVMTRSFSSSATDGASRSVSSIGGCDIAAAVLRRSGRAREVPECRARRAPRSRRSPGSSRLCPR